jgi:hypothetical protein
VRQSRPTHQLVALDRRPCEAVPALREAPLELLQRDLRERRLVALGEELGQTQFFSRPSASISGSVRPFGPEIAIDLHKAILRA